MAASALQPTYRGFVATSIDAAYLVEAAALAYPGILPLFQQTPSPRQMRRLVDSGNVIVCPVGGDYLGPRFWIDGRRWSQPSRLRDGFDLYRELAYGEGEPLTQDEINYERDNQEWFAPYLGGYVGREGSRRDGLLKKVTHFFIRGQEYVLTAYYTLVDAAANTLVRPRRHTNIVEQLMVQGLDPEFFHLAGQPAGFVMSDDDDRFPVSDSRWYSERFPVYNNAGHAGLRGYRNAAQ